MRCKRLKRSLDVESIEKSLAIAHKSLRYGRDHSMNRAFTDAL